MTPSPSGPTPGATTLPHPANATRNLWPAGIVATFVVFIGATIGLIIIASKDRNDLVSPDYYEQEIRYQRRIDQLQRTQPFTERVQASFEPESNRLRITLPPQHAAAGLSGEVQLYRPNHAGADRTLALRPDHEGVQLFAAEDLQPGLWKIRLLWSVGSEEFFAERSLQIPGRNRL